MILWDVEASFVSLPVEGYRAIWQIWVMEDLSYGGFCTILPICMFSSVIATFWKCSLEPSRLYFYAEPANRSWNQTLSRLFPCTHPGSGQYTEHKELFKIVLLQGSFWIKIQTVDFTPLLIMLLSSLRLLS